MNPILRKVRYYSKIFPIMKNFENWEDVIKLYVKKDLSDIPLKLKSGEKFFVNHHLDALTIQEIFLDKDYNVPLENPKVIIDVGANIGTFSVLYGKKYPDAKVYSFEPAPSTFSLLEKNIKINGAENIEISNTALSSKNGTITFYSNSASGLSSMYDHREGASEIKVPSVSFDDFLNNKSIEKIDLLKMDCEGAEYDIFFNLKPENLKKIKKLVMEYHDSITEHSHKDLLSFFKNNGFKNLKFEPHPLETDIGILYGEQ